VAAERHGAVVRLPESRLLTAGDRFEVTRDGNSE